MNIWRFGPLESRVDVRNRFLLRLLWCCIGIAAVLPFLKHFRHDPWAIAAVVIIIPGMGAAFDAFRLKHPDVPIARLKLIALAVLALMVATYIVVTLIVKRG